MQTLRAGPNLR